MPVLTYDRRRDEARLPQRALCFYLREWRPCTIRRVTAVRRVPLLSMSGYAEWPTYEVQLDDGTILDASVLDLREPQGES